VFNTSKNQTGVTVENMKIAFNYLLATLGSLVSFPFDIMSANMIESLSGASFSSPESRQIIEQNTKYKTKTLKNNFLSCFCHVF